MVRTVTTGAWTAEDRALVLAYKRYLDSLCPGRCGEPIEKAWHWDNEGWYEVDAEDDYTTCWACTAIAQSEDPTAKPVRHLTRLRHERDYDTDPLPPLDIEAALKSHAEQAGAERGGGVHVDERPVSDGPP